jgi:hypothetical protein
MPARPLKDYFNCAQNPLSEAMYNGKEVGFFAVIDHIDDGYAFARDIPAPQFRGLDVFERKPLPGFVVFVYPEHTLVPRQEQMFVHQLIEQYPGVKRIIIITTSAVILTDALTCERLVRSSPEQGQQT